MEIDCNDHPFVTRITDGDLLFLLVLTQLAAEHLDLFTDGSLAGTVAGDDLDGMQDR
jgi:hypothetical protein